MIYCSIIGSSTYHIVRDNERTLCGMALRYRSLSNWAIQLSELGFPDKNPCLKCRRVYDLNHTSPTQF